MIRVAAIDDHPSVLEGLASALARHDPEIEIVATGPSTDTVLAHASAVDVVLLDLQMPRPPGQSIETDVARWVEAGARVIVHTAHERPVLVRRGLIAGAVGLVLKTDTPEEVVSVIREVHNGGSAYSSAIAHALATDPDAVTDFTARELDVLQRLAVGESHKMIAKALGIASGTASHHVNQAIERLRRKGADPGNAHGVVRRAREEGHFD